ncbi:hypothetical protein CY34DRAFT_477748 [Suillus luteus UH-Slu-Lm8-n1]|uniref:Uncharacterized protein n=1 Tax=Suillus luteus UH-Slu-Lm8-n1 TaxID=930992 RepID=A0A0D0AS53_9AGAM|nr:hypothetical protein CY34DRAFT_477748 [Suillus luteus UH-Slu-Lm8-n1]
MKVTISCLQVSGRLIAWEWDMVIYLHISFIIEAPDLTKFDNVVVLITPITLNSSIRIRVDMASSQSIFVRLINFRNQAETLRRPSSLYHRSPVTPQA